MAKQSKYQNAYERAKEAQRKAEDISKSIHQNKFGYNQNSPASVTKTSLDKKSGSIKKHLALFVIALLSLIVVGLGIESAVKHQNPITVIKQSIQAAPPAKWKPNNDLANQKYNFDSLSNESSSSNNLTSSTSDSNGQNNNVDLNH